MITTVIVQMAACRIKLIPQKETTTTGIIIKLNIRTYMYLDIYNIYILKFISNILHIL